MGQGDSVLLAEPVVAVQPTLVRRLRSLERAAVLQQIHYGLRNGEAWGDSEGPRWFPARYADLARQIGITPEQARRAVEHLEREGIIESCQPEAYNRRKSYRVDYEHEVLASASAPVPSGVRASSEAAPAPLPPLLEIDIDAPLARAPDGAPSAPSVGAKRKPRARNPIYDSLAAVFPPATKSEQSRVGMTANELARLEPPPEPEMVERVARWVRREWPNATVRAVAAHWSQGHARVSGERSPEREAEYAYDCRRCGALMIDCRCPEGPQK